MGYDKRVELKRKKGVGGGRNFSGSFLVCARVITGKLFIWKIIDAALGNRIYRFFRRCEEKNANFRRVRYKKDKKVYLFRLARLNSIYMYIDENDHMGVHKYLHR